MGNNKEVWVIAYINREFINIAEEELRKYGHTDIEAYIPTVRLLKKKFKNKNIFEFVPLLFNYGFFKVPYYKAVNPDYLMELRHHITCIYAWVKDPAKNINSNGKSNLKKNNEGTTRALPMYAIASDTEVSRMIKTSDSMSIYNSEDLDRFKPGDYIKLEGYPFENMPATIISINKKKGSVKVKLDIGSLVKEVEVSFENIFYSIYKNFDENSRESSTDDLEFRYGTNMIDSLTLKNYPYEDE